MFCPTARPLARPAVLLLFLVVAAPPACAQRGEALKAKEDALQEEFVRGAAELAAEYEKAGDVDGAIRLLERVRRVVPDTPGLGEKIRGLEEDILAAGRTTLTLSAPTAWVPVARVKEGRPYRVACAGSYRMTISGEAGPDGIAFGDAKAGLVEEVPLGALMGAYATAADLRPDPPARRGTRPPQRQRDEVEAFAIGAGGPAERTADKTGVLLVRLNLPPGAKATGRLKVLLSGDLEPMAAR